MGTEVHNLVGRVVSGSIGLEYVPTGAAVQSLTYVRSVVAGTP